MLNKVYVKSYPVKHRYQTRGVVGGAYKLFDIVSLEMTLNERISMLLQHNLDFQR